MSPEQPRRPRRGTPISDGLGADLSHLGSILANHTRGLDAYLQRQAQRLDERHQNLLNASTTVLLPPDQDLEAMTARELKDLCRRQRLRGWSKLNRDQLLAFVKQKLAADHNATPADATRTERLLLLVLHQLGTAPEQVEAAWQGAPHDPTPQPAQRN